MGARDALPRDLRAHGHHGGLDREGGGAPGPGMQVRGLRGEAARADCAAPHAPQPDGRSFDVEFGGGGAGRQVMGRRRQRQDVRFSEAAYK